MIHPIPASDLKAVKKILVMQYKPFGDVLLNTAYLPELRRKFPEAQIDYLVQNPYSTLLKDNPNLDNIILIEKNKKGLLKYALARFQLIRKIRREKYDVVIDQARGPGASQITFFSGAKFRLGWLKTKKWSSLKGYNWVYNHKAVKNHHIYSARAKFDMLRPLGIVETTDNTFYHILPESQSMIKDWLLEKGIHGEKIIVFSPVTPIRSRQWKLSSFARLADIIIGEYGFPTVLLWGPGEKERVEKMASMMEYTPLIAPATSFNQAGAMLQNATVYIGNNGGVHHLAVAVGTPTLTIFGPGTNPLKWTAWHLPIHKYIISNKRVVYVDGSFGITPEKAGAAFDRMINGLST